jgi:Aspartyl protease
MSQRLLIILLLSLLAVNPTLASTRAAPLAVFHLEPHPGGTLMMTVRARVRGHEGLFIFDTGGGISYLSPSFAQAIGCKPWGQITGFVLTGQRLDMPRCDGVDFDVQGRKLKTPIAGVFDIMKFMPPNVPKLDGSLGLDAFAGSAVTLSLAEKTLTLESSTSLAARRKRGKEVSVRLVREVEGIALAVVVGVITPEGIAWMEIDSGNGGANVIAKHIAPLLNVKTGIKEPQPANFNLVGGIPVTGDVRVNETLVMDGNIGTRFLINWDLTVDLAEGRAWLARANLRNRSNGFAVRVYLQRFNPAGATTN